VLSGPAVLLLVPGLYNLLDPSGRLGGRRGAARAQNESDAREVQVGNTV
jgi:hypothetical protein